MEHYVGEELYLSQRTGNYWVDMVKIPYTVSEIVSDKEIKIKRCKLVFNGPRYFDTIADAIYPDDNGEVKTLKLSKAKKWNGKWISKEYSGDTYPYIAYFGSYEHQPYLD